MDLHGSSHEALRKVEARNPETSWRSLSQPRRHERHSSLKVGHPGIQRLQARVCHITPHGRDLLHEERIVHFLQLRGHHDQSLEGVAERQHAVLHAHDESVEAISLLPVEDAQGDDTSIWSGLVRLLVRILFLELPWDTGQECFEHLGADLLRCFASSSRRQTRLNTHDGVQELLCLLRLSSDQGVGVQAKHLGVLVHWQAFHVFPQVLNWTFLRRVVIVKGTQLVAVIQDTFIEVPFQEGADQAHILVVRHTPTVINLCNDVVQRDPRNSRLRFEVHLNLFSRDLEVAVHPLVRNVPANGSELPSLEDSRVEEGEREE
mmetsp:Transcript_25633/g.67051  ORF Transcript_25633/g.67051 Transcript_25633/m.67051 type:complete len:319 (+) Transcript_25633:575-1531(+)